VPPTIRLPQLPLQKAVFDRLVAQLAPTPVYDDVPEESAFPYVVIGEDTGSDWFSSTWGGREVTLTIHVWSQYRGMKELKTIMEKVVRNLTNWTPDLSADNFAVALLIPEFEDQFKEGEGITRHGVIRIRTMIQDLTAV